MRNRYPLQNGEDGNPQGLPSLVQDSPHRPAGLCRVQRHTQCFRLLRDGTPQGAVTSPALFNIMITDIADITDTEVEASPFADDLAIWCCRRDIADAED